ncbi:hypothetical protein LEMLEM_LOCUS10722 [Lemmus lemmus]
MTDILACRGACPYFPQRWTVTWSVTQINSFFPPPKLGSRWI